MNETGVADSSKSQNTGSKAFGQALVEARKKNNITLEEAAKAINLSVDIIDAIEKSDSTRLPGPAFVQGYLRSYARYLGVSEQQVLDIYNKEVPHAREAPLRLRTPATKEISLRTPLVQGISVVLIFSGLLALGYGIYNYYSDKADTMDLAQNTVDEILERTEESYVLPIETKMESEQQDTVEEPEPAISNETTTTAPDQQPVSENEGLMAVVDETLRITEPPAEDTEQENTFETPEVIGRAQVETQPVAPGNDEILMKSSDDSWVEISDKNGVILFYDLMPPDKNVRLKGTAPFDIFLGNAPVVRIKVNGVEINMNEHIRSNNIAHYKISVNGGQIVFVE